MIIIASIRLSYALWGNVRVDLLVPDVICDYKLMRPAAVCSTVNKCGRRNCNIFAW